MESFYELAQGRYSVRKFSDRPVEPEKTAKLLQMTQLTPTAVNYQPQHLYLFQSQEAMEKLRSCTPYSYGAPLAFLACYDKELCSYHPMTGNPSGILDSCICLTHLMMEATDLGLGSLWVNGYDPVRIRRQFHIPDRYEDVALLFVGYRREDARPARLHTQTRRLEELTTVL